MNNNVLIENVYKIVGEIGSGGMGIVYLAEHTRLGKKVVLKADKQKLSEELKADHKKFLERLEKLRREVDALKDLSHTYIPQVYDFIEKDGTIYTVIDYIDGESFDKPLKRGEKFTQAQVIEWACQLLEALAYLHSRPPHGILHADIKPANVMLTPQGDIRLIDFNIALALGEEGAVAVGRSLGYASPEHYGLDYTSGITAKIVTKDAKIELSKSAGSGNSTVIVDSKSSANSGGSTTGKKSIVLNVRSDIYSLGATLYHIMTGECPARNATDVKPIISKDYSRAVIDIITKAMNSNQELRWQSAEEMLHAFEHLCENDVRTKQYRRSVFFVSALLSVIFFIGVFTVFVGLKQLEKIQNAYVLAEYSGNALRKGDTYSAIEYALQALSQKQDIFTPPNTAEAQKALTDALKIYDLSDGFKVHKTVELPSAPIYMKISPDGKTAACIYSSALAVFNTETSEIMATLPTEQSALTEVKYIDNSTIIFAGESGIKAYDIINNAELWIGKPATSIAVSEDSKTAAAVYKNETFATVYNISDGSAIKQIDFGEKSQKVTVNDIFANPNDNLFSLNADGSLLGVSFADGALMIYDINDSSRDIEIFDGNSGYIHFEGGFYEEYFAFSATNSSSSAFAVIDTIAIEQTGGFESSSPFAVEANRNGIFVQTDNLLVKIHPVTGDQIPLADTAKNILSFAHSRGHTLITTKDEFMFFDKHVNLLSQHEKNYSSNLLQISEDTALIGSLDSNFIRIMKLETHAQTEVFDYDPSYIHDEARISADGKTIMLFSYDRFRLYGIGGDIIADVSIPEAAYLYDQQYRRDNNGSRLEVIYNDGTIRAYSAEDGSVLYETFGEKPDLTLYEEFFTDNLRIESLLHGTPTAYDRKSGKLIRELEKDAYLTYVTQTGEYIITQYVSSDYYFYGLLLNDKCETLAYLPYLCDVIGDELVFDYPTGNLRKSRIYNIDELIGLAYTKFESK